jgi:hypothetical protein
MVGGIRRGRKLVRLLHYKSRLTSEYKAAVPNDPTCLSFVNVTTALQMMMLVGFALPPFPELHQIYVVTEKSLEIVESRILHHLVEPLSRRLLVIRSYLISRVSTSIDAEPRLVYRFTNSLPGHYHYPSLLPLCLAT